MPGWTLVLAAVGTALGVINGVATFYVLTFKDRSSLRTRIEFGVPMQVAGAGPYYKSSADPGVGDLIVIKVVNVGRRPVTVTGAGVGVSQSAILGFRSAKLRCGFTRGLEQLPKKLEENDPEVVLWIYKNDLLTGIRDGLDQRPDLFKGDELPDHFWVSESSGRSHRRRLPSKFRQWFKENLVVNAASGR